jgi:hypothetical protein
VRRGRRGQAIGEADELRHRGTLADLAERLRAERPPMGRPAAVRIDLDEADQPSGQDILELGDVLERDDDP